MKARTAMLAALTLAASGATAGAAAASAPPTPDQGLNGACNMTNTNAGYGMFTISQAVANPNGWDTGMGIAITNSTGGSPASNCGVPSSPPPRP
jgi:hypothetical protein